MLRNQSIHTALFLRFSEFGRAYIAKYYQLVFTINQSGLVVKITLCVLNFNTNYNCDINAARNKMPQGISFSFGIWYYQKKIPCFFGKDASFKDMFELSLYFVQIYIFVLSFIGAKDWPKHKK